MTHDVAMPVSPGLDMSDFRGNPHACRAMEIAAAGRHHVFIVHSVSSGATMLARRLPTILPPLAGQALEQASALFRSAGLLDDGLLSGRPFRAPHHSCSPTALCGAARTPRPRPGELALAHEGVLLLAEAPEFGRQALECVAYALREHELSITSAMHRTTYLAVVQLVVTATACPCGWRDVPGRRCRCSASDVARYLKRADPVASLCDVRVRMQPFFDVDAAPSDSSASILERVLVARELQARRYGSVDVFNATVTGLQRLVRETFSRTAARAVADAPSTADATRVIRVARTIADLAGETTALPRHVEEAATFVAVPISA